jgi:iduronate 2-sulfatase
MPTTSRRKFLQSSASAAVVAAMPTAALAQDRPRRNVLFIGVDDLNTSLGCYGHKTVQSPNLDKLAGRGVRFNAAYCQYPLCNPSRSSLMTGMAPDRTRVYGNARHFRESLPDAVTLGQLFRKNGYFSARVGKIYHYNNPEGIGTEGLDDPITWDYTFNPCGVDHLKEEPQITNFTPHRPTLGSTISFYESPAKEEEITDAIGARAVIHLLEQHRKDPFFIAFGLYRPHVPWVVPSGYFDRYPLDQIQALPFEPEELHMAPPPAYWTQPPNFAMSEAQQRQAIRGYHAATTFMDAQVGKVLDALESLGLAGNTIVVFWADHGFALGRHAQWMKQTLFEDATRVPTMLAGPGITAHGQTCSRTTEHLDIYPTLVELCGLQGAPRALHGESLVSLLQDPTAAWSKPAVTQVTRGNDNHPSVIGYSVRTERYRYTSWQDGFAGEELYDYQSDPDESRNLAADPAMHEIKFVLQTQLKAITAARGKPSEAYAD